MLKRPMLVASAAFFLLPAVAGALAIPTLFHTHRATTEELAAATAGPGSLDRAIGAVERATGGRVLEIRFETGDGPALYDATVTRNGTVNHALVNSKTGQIAILDAARNTVRTFEFREKDSAEMIVRSSKVDLGSAVASAEQSSRGVAVAARTTRSQDGGMVAHDIETVRGSMVRPVLIDAKTGLVIAEPQAFAVSP